jgi:hypothetical protein
VTAHDGRSRFLIVRFHRGDDVTMVVRHARESLRAVAEVAPQRREQRPVRSSIGSASTLSAMRLISRWNARFWLTTAA